MADPMPGSMAEFAPQAPAVIDDGGTAFPQSIAEIHGIATHSGEFGSPGMSLRDYFAGQALIGLLTASPFVKGLDGACVREGVPFKSGLAQHCYDMADALLLARKEGPHAG